MKLYQNYVSCTMTPLGKNACKSDYGKLGKFEGLHNYKFMYQVGFGGFGKVWKVQNRITLKYFAMK